MKRIGRLHLTVSVAMVLFTAIPLVAWGAEGWLARKSGRTGAPPEIVSEAEGVDALRLQVRLPGVSWEDVTTKGGPFVRLDIPGGGQTTEIGAPRLPAIHRLIEVPAGARVSLEVEASTADEILLSGAGILHRIVPVQEPVPKVPGAREQASFALNASRYGTDALAPAAVAVLGEPAMIRGRQVVPLAIHPIQYNPVTGAVRLFAELSLTVRFSGGDLQKTLEAARRSAAPAFDRLLADRVLNDGQFEAADVKANPAQGVLIVVADAYESALSGLVEWKRQKGYKVEVARTSVTGSTTAQIKSYLQAAYDAWSDPPLSTVILVGDTDTIPTFSGTTGSHVSDLYYATLSGTDWLPDVLIGRISVASSTQAQTIADRVVNYEQANLTTTAWIKDATLIGTCDTGYYQVAEGTHNHVIANHLDPSGYTSDKLYCITYGADTTDVINAINAGRSLVTYSGHGSETSWAGPTLSISNVNSLTNGERTPFVTSHACLTGSFQISECFGEKWLRKTAVGFWGASNSSYWDEDDYLEKGMYEAVFDQSLYAAGEMVQYGLNHVYDVYGGGGSSKYYFEMYHLFGDPTLEIWTAEPGTLSVSHAAVAVVGATSFSVTVTDGANPVEGAMVCVYKSSDNVHESGFTGPTGQVNIPLDPALATTGTLVVTVTQHDYAPYQGSCPVILPDGPYLIYGSHAFDDSAGNGDGYANPGESVLMPVTLENIGPESCTGGSATLQTASPWVEVISDDSASYPDIPASAAGASIAPHFAWKSYAGAPDRTLVPFSLTWSCGDGSNGATLFSAEICADADADGHTTCAGDCDDGNGAVNPAAAEVCDGIDNNCDGLKDEGFDDLDNDGAASCVDCDDNDPARYPGAAEICDEKDNDCDLVVPADEIDGDSDSYLICEDDCDDGNAAVNPGVAENCSNGIDDDCDGQTDAADLDCAQPWGAAANAEASVAGAAGAESRIGNTLLLVLLPFGAVALVRVLRRRP